MTAEEVALAALARCTEVGNVRPSTRATMYRRIGLRQQQLFSATARVNPDWAGTYAIGTVNVAGAVDLTDIASPIETVDRITRVEISDEGESDYAAGREVAIVPLDDVAAFDPPRATLRNKIIQQVGSDLDDVVSLKVYYVRVPLASLVQTSTVEMPIGFDELLVIDLARELVRKSPDVANKAEVIELLTAEETALMTGFMAHVTQFTNMQRRFGSAPPVPQPEFGG